MSRLQKVLKSVKSHWSSIPHLAEITDYVATGNPKSLAKIKTAAKWLYLDPIVKAVAPPEKMGDEDRRALEAVAKLGALRDIAEWLAPFLRKEKPEEDLHALLREACSVLRSPTVQIVAVTVDYLPVVDRQGQPNSAGRHLLALSDRDLKQGIERADGDYMLAEVARMLLDHAAQRVAALADALISRSRQKKRYLRCEACVELLKRTGKTYEKPILAAWEAMETDAAKFHDGTELAKIRPAQYRERTRQLGLKCLGGKAGYLDEDFVCKWLFDNYGKAALKPVTEFLKRASVWIAGRVLDSAVGALGQQALPAVLAVLERKKSSATAGALKHLIAFKDPAHDETILACFHRGLTEGDNPMEYVTLAGRWDVCRLEEPLWKLLGHKSKPLREAAARVLGRMGDPVVPKAAELLAARKAATRMAGVGMLIAAGTDRAVKLLETHLDEEADEDVRDRVLLGLEAAWEARGKKITKKTIEKRMERAADHLKKPPAAWLKIDALPELRAKRGKLDPQLVRYLLYRQSRAKEIRPDVEAKPVYAMIDRSTSGDFALAVLEGFLASKMAPEDRWALTIAGLLGDDRAVPLLAAQIREWADKGRGKMSEYAVQALASLGTDAALSVVGALSIRYRSKYKNIGKAAVEAFAAAAEQKGVTADELGDRVVPWLGFEPGRPRLLEFGERRIEVRIGLDFKVALHDLDKNKRVASLPKAAPAQMAAEIKELKESLREVVKGQLIRLENLLVRQHRWPVDRWSELFLSHPVLLPFSVRLVWGYYDNEGRLEATFRAMEDRSLTDVEDESYALPKAGTAGIVHPLELDDQVSQTWRSHLADYEIEPPFPQLERRIVRIEPQDRQKKVSKDLAGTTINAMTFKGRAERLGWQRGSVVDGGGIMTYMKCFPGAGVDVFLGLDGMYIGIDMYEDVRLEDLYFTKGGSVEIGSYVYDEPGGEDDPRLLAFGDVPPIVYSEAMSDLEKIVGEKTETA